MRMLLFPQIIILLWISIEYIYQVKAEKIPDIAQDLTDEHTMNSQLPQHQVKLFKQVWDIIDRNESVANMREEIKPIAEELITSQVGKSISPEEMDRQLEEQMAMFDIIIEQNNKFHKVINLNEDELTAAKIKKLDKEIQAMSFNASLRDKHVGYEYLKFLNSYDNNVVLKWFRYKNNPNPEQKLNISMDELRHEFDNSLKVNGNKILFYLDYKADDGSWEGRIYLFDSHTNSVGQIATFHNWYQPYEVATTQNKIFGIDNAYESFEIYDLNIRQTSKGPNPPERRSSASVAYFKDKLYYLGGWNSKTRKYTNRVDVLIDGKWQAGPAFPLPIRWIQTITCDGILYAVDGHDSKMIYRLSDDERKWIEIGEIPEKRVHFGVASLNGKIYITGGLGDDSLNSCLCFDPSAPVGSRISPIADMNYARYHHSLIVANGKLYAIGGLQKRNENFCNSIEEYDPQTNKWREVGKLKLE